VQGVAGERGAVARGKAGRPKIVFPRRVPPVRLTFSGRPCVPEAAMNDKPFKEKPAPSRCIPFEARERGSRALFMSSTNLSRSDFVPPGGRPA